MQHNAGAIQMMFRTTATDMPAAWRISAHVDRSEVITRTLACDALRAARQHLRAKYGKHALPDTHGTIDQARVIVSRPGAFASINPIMHPVARLFARAML
jgi:hypothetical protein